MSGTLHTAPWTLTRGDISRGLHREELQQWPPVAGTWHCILDAALPVAMLLHPDVRLTGRATGSTLPSRAAAVFSHHCTPRQRPFLNLSRCNAAPQAAARPSILRETKARTCRDSSSPLCPDVLQCGKPKGKGLPAASGCNAHKVMA